MRYRALANAPVAAAGAMAERAAAAAAGGMHAPAAPTGEMPPVVAAGGMHAPTAPTGEMRLSSPPAESQSKPARMRHPGGPL